MRCTRSYYHQASNLLDETDNLPFKPLILFIIKRQRQCLFRIDQDGIRFIMVPTVEDAHSATNLNSPRHL